MSKLTPDWRVTGYGIKPEVEWYYIWEDHIILEQFQIMLEVTEVRERDFRNTPDQSMTTVIMPQIIYYYAIMYKLYCTISCLSSSASVRQTMEILSILVQWSAECSREVRQQLRILVTT